MFHIIAVEWFVPDVQILWISTFFRCVEVYWSLNGGGRFIKWKGYEVRQTESATRMFDKDSRNDFYVRWPWYKFRLSSSRMKINGSQNKGTQLFWNFSHYDTWFIVRTYYWTSEIFSKIKKFLRCFYLKRGP